MNEFNLVEIAALLKQLRVPYVLQEMTVGAVLRVEPTRPDGQAYLLCPAGPTEHDAELCPEECDPAEHALCLDGYGIAVGHICPSCFDDGMPTWHWARDLNDLAAMVADFVTVGSDPHGVNL